MRDPGTVESRALLSAGLAGFWRCKSPPPWAHSPVSGAAEKSPSQPPAPGPFLLCPRHHFPPLAHRSEDGAVGPPPGGKAMRCPGGSSRLHTHTGTVGPNHSRDTEHKHSVPVVTTQKELNAECCPSPKLSGHHLTSPDSLFKGKSNALERGFSILRHLNVLQVSEVCRQPLKVIS